MSKRLLRHDKQPKKENAASGKELAELKRENHQLRREVARLSKQIERMLQTHLDREEDALLEHTKKLPKPVVQKCEHCDSTSLKEVKMPTGVLQVCQQCGSRKVLKVAQG